MTAVGDRRTIGAPHGRGCSPGHSRRDPRPHRRCGRLFVLLVALALVGCSPTAGDPIKFGWFYRFVVELSHGDEPLEIEVIIACGSQARHILGEGRSVRALWAPYIYGVRTRDGRGVLVQSPNVCDRDVSKNPLPADFLPLVLWAPDANNLEFLIAYLHERAYEQPVSKLKFHRASVTEATEADHKAWRKTKWKENIVPIGDRKADQERGVSFFRGQGFFPKGDPRNQSLLRMECYSFVRMPMPEALRARLRERWPAERPRYWLLAWTEGDDIFRNHASEINAEARKLGLWTSEGVSGNSTFYAGTGVKRPSGTGYFKGDLPGSTSGEALRIPFRVETGYPWAGDRLFTEPTIDVHADTAGGADQGFGYCFRDVYAHYLRKKAAVVQRVTTAAPLGELAPRDHRIFIDGRLIGIARDRRSTAPGAVIAEKDEYLWQKSRFPLTHELARIQ